jgi:hypothetical protein
MKLVEIMSDVLMVIIKQMKNVINVKLNIIGFAIMKIQFNEHLILSHKNNKDI